MSNLSEVFKKYKFTEKQIEAIGKWATAMKEVSVYFNTAQDPEPSEYIKGYDKCLQDIIDACKKKEEK